MKQKGKIISVEGAFAYALIKKEGSCAESCASCTLCDQSKLRRVYVYNEAGAKEGEEVYLTLESYKSMLLATITYLLPLIIFFVSYMFVKNELMSGLILVAAFLLCAYVANLLAKQKAFMSKTEKL